MSKLSFTIYVTTKCNMDCHYCYEKGYVPSDMSILMADKVVSFIHQKITEEKPEMVNVQFHGGEPLLNFPVIHFFVSELEKKGTGTDVHFRYSMTTNATLLKEEMIPTLQKFHALSVSIDGGERTHDRNRIFKNRQGTYHTVKKNTEKLLEIIPGITGRMTLTSDTYSEVYHSFLHIVDLGITNVEMELDFMGNNWTEEMIKEYAMKLQKIANKVHEKEKMGINIKVPLLNSAGGKSKNSICNGGRTSFTIAPDGKIYPCLVAVSTDKFLLGNLNESGKPLNPDVLNKIEEVAKRENPSCGGCARYDYCKMTRCKIINYIYNGDFFMPSPIACANERIMVSIGKYFLNRPYNY